MFAKDDNGTFRTLNEQKIIGPEGQQASRQILQLWTAAELKAWNIFPLTEDAVPVGKREVSRSFVRTGDNVRIVKVLEDIPGAVPHAIGVNGIVTQTAVMVPPVALTSPDVFPSNLTVGQTYDAKEPKFDKLDKTILECLFRVNNDVRVLKGQAVLTVPQFKTFIKGLMS